MPSVQKDDLVSVNVLSRNATQTLQFSEIQRTEIAILVLVIYITLHARETPTLIIEDVS